MILLVRQELCKLYRRYAPYVIYALIALLTVLVVIGFRTRRHGSAPGPYMASVEVVGDPTNGLLICQMIAETVSVLLIYLGPVVVGELLWATLRGLVKAEAIWSFLDAAEPDWAGALIRWAGK